MMKQSMSQGIMMVLAWFAVLSGQTKAFSPKKHILVSTRNKNHLVDGWVSRMSAASTVVKNWNANVASADSGAGPAVLDRPTTITKTDVEIEKEQKTQQEKRFGSEGWEIRLFNDPWNKREFVARCLKQVCSKSDTESYQIMMQAHNHGMGVVGRYVFEIAELYHKSLRENGLLVDMVPVDDE